MNNHWGYCPNDKDYKPASMIIRKLVECVSKNGNMILNVGPDARGRINAPSRKILKELGQWMDANGESVYGCAAAGIEKPEWGRYTKKGNKIYAHVLDCPLGPLALTGLKEEEVVSMRRLVDKAEVRRGESWITKSYEGIPFACLGDIPHFTYFLPDEADTVIEITLKEER